MNTDNDSYSNDLTQLSSREQLSALMDDALPADQTRFLLRRLQHDTALAEGWDRWRFAGEVMRGSAPQRRLPIDFSTRVAAAVAGRELAPMDRATPVVPRWRRWGGGAALVASLAVAAVMLQQPIEAPDSARITAATPVPASNQAQTPAPTPTHMPQPAIPTTPDALAATAGVAVAVVRPKRSQRARMAPQAPERAVVSTDAIASAQPAPQTTVPQLEIAPRPWPRSVLPLYENHNALTVGFGGRVFTNSALAAFPAPMFVSRAPTTTASATPAHTSEPAGSAPADPATESQP